MDIVNDIRNIFIYDSPIGKFYIQFDNRLNKWMLSIDNTAYGHYISPVAAADDVYCQVTGYYEWDSFDIESILDKVPTDIYCWEAHKTNNN